MLAGVAQDCHSWDRRTRSSIGPKNTAMAIDLRKRRGIRPIVLVEDMAGKRSRADIRWGIGLDQVL